MITNIDGVSLHYEVFGEGRPLLLLHGWGGCVNSMAPIWQYFKEKFKVYVIDFPGQENESSDPPIPWGVPEYAKMVEDFIDMLKIEKVDVIAHSFGGRVAIFMASHNHELFHRIVLVDSAGIRPKETMKKKMKNMAFQLGKKLIKLALSEKKYEKKMQEYRAKYSSPDYMAIRTETMRKSFQKIIQLDLTDVLEQINNPTLLIWGEKDIATPLYMAKIMEKKIPDAGLVVLPNAGHFSYIDESEKFNIIVNEFLK